jgi:uncharacterized NAD(P)/FAD-binding protein YdhS
MPREAHAVISAAMTRNTLQLRAGQVHAVNATENCIMVHFRARDSGLTDTLQAARLINCTGPDTRLHHLDRRLIGRLARRGTLRNDPCTLGIDTSDSLQPLDRHGHCTPGLYYLGPLLRAGYGEATAVPELRQFALQLAQHLTAPVRTLT